MTGKNIKQEDWRMVVIALIRGLKFTVALLEKALRGELKQEKP